LLEVIERDAFMIFYLNKLSPPIINIQNSQDKLLEKIFSSIKRYKLELYILDISTDVPVYSILAIVIDKTGFGPAISLGMKSDLYIKNAIIGAIEESFHSRFWIKDIMIQKKIKSLWMEIQKKKDYISDLKERGIIWSELQMINKINFFFKGKKVLLKKTSSTKTENLDSLLKWFTKQNIEVLYVNITPARLEREKIYVVKVIIPQFQPLYLDERFPYWEGKRLKEIPQKLGLKLLKKVYKFPHPFL
jgi:ribosomal protein S12 methylthiotransferase accessory factor